MRIGNLLIGRIALNLLICIAAAVSLQCAVRESHTAALPSDILGISIGMNKETAARRLEEIAVFERDERRRQQVWRMKDQSRFSHVAVGYDEKGQIRYVTAFVDKAAAKERLRYADIGDLEAAKKEIVEPHRRYIWEVPAKDGKPAYNVIINGDEPEFVSIYSLSKPNTQKEEEEKSPPANG